ncbi:MAG TPA: hypothetical protein VIL20_18350 [Sandaracinaceae bacterium]
MTGIEREWTGLVLSSFAGSSAGLTVDEGEVDYVASALRFTSAASRKACLGLRVAIVMVMTAPLWMWGRLTSLRGLTREERSDLLDQMLRHRVFFVRELCLLLKLVACMAIFRSPAMREKSGFDAPSKRSLPIARTKVS